MSSMALRPIVIVLLSIAQALSSQFQCPYQVYPDYRVNRSQIFFKDLEKWTDGMCAQCFVYIELQEHPWKPQFLQNYQRQTIYVNYPNIVDQDTTTICYTLNNNTDECFPSQFRYKDLNRTEPNIFFNVLDGEKYMDLVLNCCEDAMKCCQKSMKINEENERKNVIGCPSEWDGLLCWDSTPPDTTLYDTCPDMVMNNEVPLCTRESASKDCLHDGTWYKTWKNDGKNAVLCEHTEFKKCSLSNNDLKLIEVHLYVAFNVISVLFTLLGTAIFLFYKQHRIFRIQIHLNFFMSLALTSFFSILKNLLIKEPYFTSEEVIRENPNWCKAIVALEKWIRLVNYCWMFNEGLFLHHSIVAAFRQMRRAKYYYLFGWGVPTLLMVPYIAVHSMFRFDTMCWQTSMRYPEYVYTIPPVILIFINTILLINVVRVLMTKLRSSPEHFKAGLRASIILMPIFGVQYIFYILVVDPYQTCLSGHFAIRYIQITIEALQGAIVTTIFCFMNAEIHFHIKKTLRRISSKSIDPITEENSLERIPTITS